MTFAVYIIVSGLISNILGYFIPRSVLNYNSFPYKTYKWEKDGEVYNKLYVSKWKKKVPDMSKLLKTLYPKEITYPPTSCHIDRLVRESCVAEFIHILLIALSPIIYRIIGGYWGWFYTVCSILGNIPYIVIQRFNRPKMKRLHASLCLKEAKSRCSEELINESIDIVV